MESMSDTTNETVQQGDRNSLTMSDISDDIIDVLAIDLSDNDTWLEPPSLGAADASASDTGFWLRSNTEQDCNNSHDSKRSIDTRTFTRPKKRLGRLSFDFITEPTPSQSSNVWNRVSQSPMKEDDENAESVEPEEDSIPHMLRPSVPGVSGFSSTPPGHESLEAFLNMSRSKGIDSFIDLAEPEFNDDIMDVSQPSVLYSSVLSGMTDDLSQTTNQTLSLNESQASKNLDIEDSQILTESMMQMSMFGDVVDVNFNDTFAKNTGNITVLENIDYCTSGDTTFLATTETDRDTEMDCTFSTTTFSRPKFQPMDATYTPSALNKTLTNDPHASYIVSRSPCRTSDLPLSMIDDTSYIVTPEIIDRKNFIAESHIAKDASFIITSVPPPENTTFSLLTPKTEQQNHTYNLQAFDATYQETVLSPAAKSRNNPQSETPSSNNEFMIPRPLEKPSAKIVGKIDSGNVAPLSQGESLENLSSTFHRAAPKMHSKLSAPRSLSKFLDTQNIAQENNTFDVDHLDATFDKPPMAAYKKSPSNSASKQAARTNKVNELYEVPFHEQAKEDEFTEESMGRGKSIENLDTTVTKSPSKLHSKLNAPRSFSKLVTAPNAMQQYNTSNVHHLDSTFEKTMMPSPRKLSLVSSLKSSSKENVANETFKAPFPREKVISHFDRENVDTTSHGGSLDNLDTTFHKPAPKKLNPPRQLSRLPQSFQKSNPNLGSSSLKYTTTKTRTRSTVSSFGFNRGTARSSTARNPDSVQFTSKLLVLGKMKSGSDQRLDVTRNVSDLQITGSGGSTESIDSTQSAHSAPDFDDRLSVRSDGSNASYSMRSMNIEEFQKIVRMREESLRSESTPRTDRRVMENNWVAAPTDLPSPILKNGREVYGSRGSSPRSTDSTVKTSSPLLSPAESLQNLPIDPIESSKSNVQGNKLSIPRNKSAVPNKISQASSKPPLRSTSENRTGLRPPSSWTSGNRPASGIPRPASRIPGPRLVRPSTTINQGDTRK